MRCRSAARCWFTVLAARGILAPRRVTSPVGHVDLVPTLANLAGARPERTMAGRSLVPLLAGAPDEDHDVYQEVSFEGPTERRGLVTRHRVTRGRLHVARRSRRKATRRRRIPRDERYKPWAASFALT